MRHDSCLVNVIISFFRWCVRYGINQWSKTCDAIVKQHMRSQVRLRLRRNCKFYSDFDAKPPCGFLRFAFTRAGTFGLKKQEICCKGIWVSSTRSLFCCG